MCVPRSAAWPREPGLASMSAVMVSVTRWRSSRGVRASRCRRSRSSSGMRRLPRLRSTWITCSRARRSRRTGPGRGPASQPGPHRPDAPHMHTAPGVTYLSVKVAGLPDASPAPCPGRCGPGWLASAHDFLKVREYPGVHVRHELGGLGQRGPPEFGVVVLVANFYAVLAGGGSAPDIDHEPVS